MINDPSRTVVITGAAGHIGRAYALKASMTASCILIDRDTDPLEAVMASLNTDAGQSHRIMHCDLIDSAARKSLVDQLTRDETRIDVLVNNAAFTGSTDLKGWVAPFEEQSLEAWQGALEVNLTAAFELAQGLSGQLKSSPDGNILNIGSIYGCLGPDLRLYDNTAMGNPAAYAASKGGLIQLTRWLATVLAPEIRVNCISPGGVFRDQPSSFVQAYESRTPLKRMATEADIVGAMMFLTLGESRYITGQNLTVDGGFSIW